LTNPPNKSSITIEVQVQPKSSRDEVIGSMNGRLKVKVSAPPVRGKANRRLRELISRLFDVRKSNVKIIRGETSKLKLLRIEGLSMDKKDWFNKNFSI